MPVTTVVGYQIAADHMIELLGGIKLASLKAHDVQGALEKLATRWSSRTVRLYRMVMVRAIRLAQVNDLAMRNVAELTTVPKGQLLASTRSSPKPLASLPLRLPWLLSQTG
jgi:hypothetical protein